MFYCSKVAPHSAKEASEMTDFTMKNIQEMEITCRFILMFWFLMILVGATKNSDLMIMMISELQRV